MASTAILVLCAQAVLIQSAFGACTSRAAVEASGICSPFGYAGSLAPGFTSLAYDGLAYPGTKCAGRGPTYDGIYYPAMELPATSGGGFSVTSFSSTAPTGISIVSDNVYEGALNVVGELPFVGTSGLEGVVNTAGSGAINHACGNGHNAMSAFSATSTPASVTTAGLTYGTDLAYDCLVGSAVGAKALTGPGFAAPGIAHNALSYTDAAWFRRSQACDGLSPLDGMEITPTSGGALPISSASATAPTGIAVASDNAYEGALAVGGELPFVGTVGLEGVVPSAGAGAVNHACGNGKTAMISEATAFGPTAASAFGYRAVGRGCGCAN